MLNSADNHQTKYEIHQIWNISCVSNMKYIKYQIYQIYQIKYIKYEIATDNQNIAPAMHNFVPTFSAKYKMMIL